MVRTAMKILAMGALLGTGPARAASLAPSLVDELRHGGYVLVMRHASSPTTLPDKTSADPGNAALERQLDENGRNSAAAMGQAFKSLRIPVGQVFSSPTYRARETIRLAGFGVPKTIPELGDQGHSMERLKGPGPAAWLSAAVTHLPKPGTNTLIVTHMPNIAAAFPADAGALQDGETIVFKPDGHGHAKAIAKVAIGDWPSTISAR